MDKPQRDYGEAFERVRKPQHFGVESCSPFSITPNIVRSWTKHTELLGDSKRRP